MKETPGGREPKFRDDPKGRTPAPGTCSSCSRDPSPWGERRWGQGWVSHLGLDHVDAPGTEGLHAVVDVHDPLTLGHVQHHIQDDVATGAASARAAETASQTPSEPQAGSRGPRGLWGAQPHLHHAETQRDNMPEVYWGRGDRGQSRGMGSRKRGVGGPRGSLPSVATWAGREGQRRLTGLGKNVLSPRPTSATPTHPSKPHTSHPFTYSRSLSPPILPNSKQMSLLGTPSNVGRFSLKRPCCYVAAAEGAVALTRPGAQPSCIPSVSSRQSTVERGGVDKDGH